MDRTNAYAGRFGTLMIVAAVFLAIGGAANLIAQLGQNDPSGIFVAASIFQIIGSVLIGVVVGWSVDTNAGSCGAEPPDSAPVGCCRWSVIYFSYGCSTSGSDR